jgi:hypothetical protein
MEDPIMILFLSLIDIPPESFGVIFLIGFLAGSDAI